MPKFSIVIPVYNNEKYFPFAIDSILSQEYDDFEVIIVDDGSTDQTPVIADSYVEKDKRVRVIHQENQWIHASVNNGVVAAKGDYVYIVNPDDRLRAESLKHMAEKVQLFHPDVI